MSDIVIKLTLDASQLKEALAGVKTKLTEMGATKVNIDTKDAQNKITSLRDSIAMWGLAINGVVSAFRTVANTINAVIAPAMEAETAVSALNAALNNAGIYTADMSKSLRENADALMQLTIYDDEAILKGTALAENIGHIAADQLPRAQRAAIGLAAAYGIDLTTAFQLVGKAAAGSTSMLGRYGIVLDQNLSSQEKFNAVLEIGEGKFGIAEQAAKTTAGQFEQFKNLLNEMLEQIGGALLPIINEAMPPLIDILKSLTPIIVPLVKLIGTSLANAMKIIAEDIQFITPLLEGLGKVFTVVGNGLEKLMPSLAKNTDAVGMFAASAFEAADGAEQLGEATNASATEAETDLYKFQALAGVLLDLKSKTNLSTEAKQQEKEVISELNSKYGQYLGNIDLEAAKYGEVAAAIGKASEALIGKAMLSAYETKLGTISKELVDAQDKLSKLPYDYKPGAKNTDWNRLENITINARSEMYKVTQSMMALKADLLKDFPGLFGGGGGGGGGSAAAAQSEFDRLIQELTDYQKTEIDKITAQAEEKRALILKNTKKDSTERVNLLKELDAWETAEKKKITDKTSADEEAARKALNDKKLANETAYYEAMKFKDSEYYQWKVRQIVAEVQAMGLSEEKTTALIRDKVAALQAEQDAYNKLPLDAVIAKYQAFKSEMADTKTIGVAQWAAIRDGLLAFKAELEKFADQPGVKEILDKLQGEIDVAQLNAGKQKSFFWSTLMGFDPDKEEDRAKIQAVKDTFSNLMSMTSNVVSGMLQRNQERKDSELAAVDEVAQKEMWSQQKILEEKAKINKKYAEEDRKLHNIQKAMSITQAIINTAEAVSKALTMGGILGPIMAGIIAALGAVQIKLIASQKFAGGGLFRGKGGPRDDSNLISVSDGEYIVNAEQTRRWKPLLDVLNFGVNHQVPAYAMAGAFAGGGLIEGGSGSANNLIERLIQKVEVLNMNLVKKDLSLTVINKNNIETDIKTQDKTRARMVKRGYDSSLS